MLYARGVGLANDVPYPLKPSLFTSSNVTFRKSKELWTKSSEWKNAAYEGKEKSHYFIHPAQKTTNSHPRFNQRERMRTWEKKETHTGSNKKYK